MTRDRTGQTQNADSRHCLNSAGNLPKREKEVNMIRKYSFGNVFRTDSVVAAIKAQEGDLPYLRVNEEEMSLTYTMDPGRYCLWTGRECPRDQQAGMDLREPLQ